MQRIDIDLNQNNAPLCNDKAECIDDLKRSYITPGHTIAFAGINAIQKYYHPFLSRNDIENVLSEIENYTLHREFHSQKRNPSYSHYKRYQFQCDLVDVRHLAEFNDGINYLLTVIDTFTRYAFVRPLKTKTGKEVTKAFLSVLNEASEDPKLVVFDRGTEFYNQDFIALCNERNIKLFSPDSSIHGAFIERFNRTLQSLVYKFMTENETNRYLDYIDKQGIKRPVLQSLVISYNTRIHRMIGTSPFNAEHDENSHMEIRKKMSTYYQKIKPKKPKFNIGDTVRVMKLKGKFDRGYNERAAKEIFKIHGIKTNLKIPMYILSNYRGNEIIKGNFYQHELVKVSGDIFRIEKVLKRRTYRGKKQIYVKWKGFDDSFNEWINANQISQVFNEGNN